MCGGGTVNDTLVLLGDPSAMTFTGPVVTLKGAVATICVSDQLVMMRLRPLIWAVLVPWVAPKLVPVIVTLVPFGPDVGETLVTAGTGTMVTGSALPVAP